LRDDRPAAKQSDLAPAARYTIYDASMLNSRIAVVAAIAARSSSVR
jgi:hypothetical protein